MSDNWTEPDHQEDMSAWLCELNADLDFVDEWQIEPDLDSPHTTVSGSGSNLTSRSHRRKRSVKKSDATRLVAKTPGAKDVTGHPDGRNKKKLKPLPFAPLLVFPSFDRSNATIYFASTFARMSNNGDIHGLQKLITTHCAKDIDVRLQPEFSVPLPMFLDMLAIYSTISPDLVSCMHSTKVVDNTISAVLYTKVTDLPEMYNYNACVVEDKYKWIFVGTRRALFDKKYKLPAMEKTRRDAIYQLLDKEAALQVYGRVDMTLTLHPRTKKVADFAFVSTYTSVFHDNVHYSLL